MPSANAYLSVDSRPTLRQSITGFVDVLGFSNLSTSTTNRDDSQQLLERIAGAIHDSRNFARSRFADAALSDPSRWAVKFFSDNLVFGIPVDGHSANPADAARFGVLCSQCYQLRMILNGFFVRGALTVGDICLTDEIIFGSALVECYRLETHVSVVPRLLLTDALQKILAGAAISKAGPGSLNLVDGICRDVDGRWFVNYLQAACTEKGVDWNTVDQHKARVIAALSSTTHHEILPKFGWTCRYHNLFCHWHRNDPGYSDRYRIPRIDEESTIFRFSEIPTAKTD